MTATGASIAQSAPQTIDVSHTRAASARQQSAADSATRADLADRRSQAASQQSVRSARRAQAERVSRDKARQAATLKMKRLAAAKAKAAEQARAKAEEERVQREGKAWVTPLASMTKTSNYGMRWGRMHEGTDFGCHVGQPLRAMTRGTVVFTGRSSWSSGNKTEIKYWDGTTSAYLHQSEIYVHVGEEVMPGEVVGACGNTGRSFGAHLHLEITLPNGTKVNPLPWLVDMGLY